MICPVCANTTFSSWGHVNGYAIERCRQCGLGVTAPFPPPDAVSEINRAAYLPEQRVQTYRSRHEEFTQRYRRQLRDIQKFTQGGRLLDIGCNIGLFLNEARSAGFDVTGVELNTGCADHARTGFGLEVHSDYLHNINFAAESFDVVTMYDVLEHIADLPGMLSGIRRILRPDGLLVIQSPNIDSVMAELCQSGWGWLSPPDHLYHFTPGTLSTLLDHAGYAVRTVKTWEPADDFCADVLQAKLGRSLPARIIHKLLRLSGLAVLVTKVLQPYWWNRQRGALVELYATKR